MYAEYYQLTSEPFLLSPTGKPCYVHPSYSKARSYLEYALSRDEGIVLISGDPGTGKTTLVKDLMKMDLGLKSNVVSISLSNDSAEGLILAFAAKLGCETPTDNISQMLQEIEYRLKQIRINRGRTILVIDEAQILSFEALEQARLFSNYVEGDNPLLQVVLVGQEQLTKKILSPQLVQLHQRIVVTAQLEKLAQSEVREFFFHALSIVGWTGTPAFEDEIFSVLANASQGNPRWINQIGSRLMLRGMLDEKTLITKSDVTEVVSDLISESLLPQSYRDADAHI